MSKFLWLLCLPVLATAGWAEVTLFNPPDKFVTYSPIVMLQGQSTPAAPLLVNNTSFTPKDDGSFSCGLVLNKGKNRIEAGGKTVRVLRLVTFPDIEQAYEGKKHWARGPIVYLATLGMIEGYPDGNFYPGNPVTRGELATWLAKAKKLPVPTLEADVFFDVPKEQWRAPYVKAITAAGYMPPYSTEMFGLDDPISRREAAEIAIKTEGLGIVAKITSFFRDVPQQERGAAPIYTAREGGLVIGVSKDVLVYDPERAITRAEAATLVARFSAAQWGIRYLSDFESGYGPERLCGLNVAPRVVSFAVLPAEVGLKPGAKIRLRAELASREVFAPLAKVKVDLSSIGGLADAEMYDDGTGGDDTPNDLIYALNLSFDPLSAGTKTFWLSATDKLGWEGTAQTTLLVVK